MGFPAVGGGVQTWLVSSNGCSVPFLGTRREPDGGGAEAIVFPRLPAGRWSYVETRTPEETAAILTGRASRLTAIETFTVAAGATTRVESPARRR